MLDCSQRSDLALHAQVLADVHVAAAVLDVRPLIVGAFARDLLLAYAHGIPIGRQTEDLDLGLAVGTWDDFEQLRRAMLASGRFASTAVAHRLRRGALLVDLVPFGAIETAQRTLAWPPDGLVVMDVFGYQEALRAAIDVRLPGDVATRVVPLPGLSWCAGRTAISGSRGKTPPISNSSWATTCTPAMPLDSGPSSWPGRRTRVSTTTPRGRECLDTISAGSWMPSVVNALLRCLPGRPARIHPVACR